MSYRTPICPYPHAGGVRAQVVVLEVTAREIHRQIGGYRLKPRIVHGVEFHCTVCHCEGWIQMVPTWQFASWDGPRKCSCGESARYRRPIDQR